MNTHSSTSASTSVIDSNLHELITGIGDDKARKLYPIEKLDAHVRNVPHVAISIFVFHDHMGIQLFNRIKLASLIVSDASNQLT